MTKQNWQAIYTAGNQLNRYPYDFIVSSFFRYRDVLGHHPRVLDLGCGAGNHSIFCAENGASVTAVDYSEAALAVLRQRALSSGIGDRIETVVVDFEDFQMSSRGFDLVIDRLSVTHVGMGYAHEVYSSIYECMNPGGLLFSNLFSTGHTHKEFGDYDEKKRIWHSFKKGIFKNLKSACFYSFEDVQFLLRKYNLEFLCLESEKDILDEKNTKELWKIIGIKNAKQ
jgi:cyclopropane fatty-acyl-phospholipid synthase-like methyltransferase